MNYILPEGFNFYNELAEKINTKSECKDNICLIEGIPLTPSHITLECGHSFNYIPLLNDAYQEKYHRAKNYSYSNRRLKDNQLKCPYCRKIQNKILPYFPDMYLQKVRGINSPSSLSMGENNCNYIFKSGKNKGCACNKQCYREKCPQHFKSVLDFDAIEKTTGTLKKYTVAELKKMGKHFKLKGYSKLKKNDLINKIINI